MLWRNRYQNMNMVRSQVTLFAQAGIADNAAAGPNIEAILVGHAHYDHLLDVEPVVRRISGTPRVSGSNTDPTVYGSRSAANILAGGLAKLQAVNPIAITPTTTPQWTCVNGGAIRFVAIESSHAPNSVVMGVPITISQGTVDKPLRNLPRRARGWKKGRTFAYMIDFMNTAGGVDFRIYYQDAAHVPDLSHSPISFPGLGLGPVVDVDVAIICVANFNYADGYVERIRDVINPRQYVLGHWENFLGRHRDSEKDLYAIKVTDPEKLIGELMTLVPGANWVLPVPMATVTYP